MLVVTPKQMNRIEERSEKLGVSRKQLMANAGRFIAERIAAYTSKEMKAAPENTSVVFLAGSGNNGGDCFVAAERLVYKGFRVTVVNLVKAPQTDIAKEAFEKLPERVKLVKGFRSENEAAALEAAELDYMTIREKDIIRWRDSAGLHFLQCACKFTQNCSSCADDGTSNSKRLETKKLIAALKETVPQVESNIFRATENVVLNKVLGYKIHGKKHSFLEDY